jgi:hypothetical protein
MLQTLIVIIDKENQFILIVHNTVLAVDHFYGLELFKNLIGQTSLELVQLLSYALFYLKGTRTNYTKT